MIGAQYFTVRYERFQKQVAQWQEEDIVARWQFNLYALTASGLTTRSDSTLRFVGTPKMNSLADAPKSDLDIAFNTRIEAIKSSSDGWILVSADGEPIKELYDWVVMSSPAEQSRVLLTGTALEHQIPEQIHDPCWALALATLGEIPAGIQDIFGDSVVSWVSRLSARPWQQDSGDYDDLWMLHFSSKWSVIHAKDTEIDVTQTGLEWLSAALDKQIEKPLEVVHDFKHYWLYARMKNEQATSSIIVDRSMGLAAIGAWSAGGRVQGAYFSALDFVDYLFE
jgi:predicted NAD/FAD-dependent oxidoreductase